MLVEKRKLSFPCVGRVGKDWFSGGYDNMQIYSSITAQAGSKLDWGNAPTALKWMLLTVLCQSVISLSPFFCDLNYKKKKIKQILPFMPYRFSIGGITPKREIFLCPLQI